MSPRLLYVMTRYPMLYAFAGFVAGIVFTVTDAAWLFVGINPDL